MTVVPLFTVGGSKAAVAANAARKSRLRLQGEMLGWWDEEPPTEEMYWGTQHQDTVYRHMISEGVFGVEPAPSEGFRNENGRPWMVAHLDGFCVVDDSPAILEIKTTNAHAAREWFDGDRVPMPYMLQMHHYFYVTGYDVGLFAVLIGGNRLEYRTVYRDEKLIRLLLPREDLFVEHLKSGVPLPAERKGDAALLAPQAEVGRIRRATREIEREMREIRIHHEVEKAHKAQRERREERVKAFMGEASILISRRDDDLATWKPESYSYFDKKALPAELVERHTEKRERRRFVTK